MIPQPLDILAQDNVRNNHISHTSYGMSRGYFDFDTSQKNYKYFLQLMEKANMIFGILMLKSGCQLYVNE